MAEFVKLNPSELKALHEQNPYLVAYNVEFAEVTGGTFWKAYTPEQIAGTAPVANSARLADLLRRPQITYADIAPFDASRPELPKAVTEEVEIQIKYAGYLARQLKQVEEFKKEESRLLPAHIDYEAIAGLRLEARQKLSEIRPMSIGQAGRISGVSPADIAVLLIWLEQNK